MTPQQIVGLGIRFLSILAALHSLHYLIVIPASLAGFNDGGMERYTHLTYITGAALIVAAIILWKFPMTIAKRIIPGAQGGAPLRLQMSEAARVGCSLIGLWVLATQVTSLLWFVFSTAARISGTSYMDSLATAEKLELIFYICAVGFSLFLIFKAHVFAAMATKNMESKQNITDEIRNE